LQFDGVRDNQKITFAYGHAYRMVMGSQTERENFLREFEQRPHTVIVARDGGLISSLSVWENLILPVDYQGIKREKAITEVYNLLALCGLSEPTATQLIQRMPAELTLFEKRLVSFVRAMLVEPESLVWDMPYDGLAAGEVDSMVGLQSLFHLRFPLRISVTLCFGNRMPDSMDD
jgi:ABC-type transporter Mla maintaining outer membrane lipid asymmetry ATPase subunit MlaF